MLGRTHGALHIDHFRYDSVGEQSAAAYSPDHLGLTALLRGWNAEGIDLVGWVHSHPTDHGRPSQADVEYAGRFLSANSHLDEFVLPIVLPSRGTEWQLLPYIIRSDTSGVSCQAAVVTLSDVPTAVFDRVSTAYDIDRLSRSRVVAVGVGGSASFIEDLARTGVGEFVLIDPDAVEEVNVATQQAYRRDIGRLKTDAVADRIRSINPNALVVSRSCLLDEISDEEFGWLATAQFSDRRPLVSAVAGMTDSFRAQARVNRLALKFGLPSMCAQVYERGYGAEVTFTYPGVTPACHRCILESRYRAQENYAPEVGSRGTPIFATSRLNALKGFVCLALLHHRMLPPLDSTDPTYDAYWRFGVLLSKVATRNLAQIRMDPESSAVLQLPSLGEPSATEGRSFDETVWTEQRPRGVSTAPGPCPDCGGSGDLRRAIGGMIDTRQP
jgi:hypothetical protein